MNIFTILFENNGTKVMQMVPADSLAQAQEKARLELNKSMGQLSNSFAITMSSNAVIEMPKEAPKNEIQGSDSISNTVSKILLANVTDKMTAKIMLEYIAQEYCNDVDKDNLIRVSKRLL